MPALIPAIPWLTPDLRGCGGRIRSVPEDFLVEEVPAYEPSGEGEHLFLWMEKRGVGPEFFARGIAQRLNIPVAEVGTAGLKDRHALTRQWVSIPARCEGQLAALEADDVRILQVRRHANKLKPGHLRGNRFTLRIRQADPQAAPALKQILERIRTQGLPNYYGPQRFGRDGSTAELGFRCLAGTASKRIRPFLFKFALSAAQSVLFNEVLARRHRDGLLRTVLLGDAMLKWPTGGMFVAEDLSQEQPRLEAREIIPGGPMFGSRTFPTQAIAAEREDEVLRDYRITPATFQRFGKLAGGTRRHNFVYLDDLEARWEGTTVCLQFTLPAGSYATVLLREVMKTDPDEEPESEDSSES
jgi:tRNA pseudouridine13 synthase